MASVNNGAIEQQLHRLLDLRSLSYRYDSRVLRQWLVDQELADVDDLPEPQNNNQLLRGLRTLNMSKYAYWLLCGALTLTTFWWLFTLVYSAYLYANMDVWQEINDPRREKLVLETLPPYDCLVMGVAFTIGCTVVELVCIYIVYLPGNGIKETSFWDVFGTFISSILKLTVYLDAMVLVLFFRSARTLFTLAIITWIVGVLLTQLMPMLRVLLSLYRRRDYYSMSESSLGPLTLLLISSWYRVTPPSTLWHQQNSEVSLPSSSAAPESASFVQLATLPSDSPYRSILPPAPCSFSSLKMCHAAFACGWMGLANALMRIYVPLSVQDCFEFEQSLSSFLRCYSVTLVFLTLRIFFLLDYSINSLVLVALGVSLLAEFCSLIQVLAPKHHGETIEDWWDFM